MSQRQLNIVGQKLRELRSKRGYTLADWRQSAPFSAGMSPAVHWLRSKRVSVQLTIASCLS